MNLRELLAQFSRLANTYLARLSVRERRLVATFAALLVTSGVYLGIVEPLINGRRQLEQKITTLSEEVEALKTGAARVSELQRALARHAADVAGAGDFSIFSFVDKAASASIASGSVAAMNPSRRKVRDGEEESLVEVRLSVVPLTEIVAFLRQIEEAAAPVFIRRVELKRRYDDHSRFDATVVAVTIEKR